IIFCQALEVFTINSPIVEGSAAGVMARNKVPPRPLSRAEWTWLTAAHNRIEKYSNDLPSCVSSSMHLYTDD
ncbi:hypothetical protein HPB47_015315, partial [Ixodes persulcatus]